MVGIATIRQTVEFLEKRLPLSGVPLPFSTRQWEYPWCYNQLMEFEVGPGSLVLDVGCACNPFMVELARLRYHVTGLDLYSVNDPRNPHPKFGGFDRALENEYLTFREGSMASIPFEDNKFDAVYCISVLEHCDEDTRRVGIREMLRVLKSGGPLIITEDYIPKPIERLPGILEACKRTMDYDFRDHIAATGRPLADPNTPIPSDDEIARMRNQGELLLNCVVAPNEYYHFTAVGFVVRK